VPHFGKKPAIPSWLTTLEGKTMTPGAPAATPPYLTLLQQLKTCFPGPVSNPVMDGYFVHTLARFLDRVDPFTPITWLLSEQHSP
jgi:hypothetical protein